MARCTRLKAGAGAGLRAKTVRVTVNGVQLVLLFGFVALQGRDPLGWPRVAVPSDFQDFLDFHGFVTCVTVTPCVRV